MNICTKLKNFWFYHKNHVLIGLAVLLVLAYLGVQKARTVQPDYHIGLVRSVPCTDQELQALETRFTAAGEDLNGDGEILIKIHTYYVDLADSSPDAGVSNAEVVQALDADLIGGMSGIFLLEDVDTFQQITNGILADSCAAFDSGLWLAIRADAAPAYEALFQNIS